MSRTRTALVAGALSAALAVPFLPAGSSAATAKSWSPSKYGKVAVGLVDGDTLVRSSTNRPDRVRVLGRISGLQGDSTLVGIDYRVQDNRLYAVGDAGGVYVLKGSGKARKVSQLTVALEGSEFGVDFNPVADRLRVVSDTGQNLRHDVNPGGATIADVTLTYPPATAPVAGVTAAAYTNNDLDADTGTSLFVVDTALDQVALQSPANNGTLAPTGKLGVAAGSDAGFDIDRRNHGWASLQIGGRQQLVSVDLLSGDVARRGAFPKRLPVSDLAFPTR